MALITLMNAQLAFGHVALLDHATLVTPALSVAVPPMEMVPVLVV